MQRVINKAGLAIGGLGVAMLAFAGPASATTGGGAASGSGTIFPGLTQAGSPGQSVTFSGTVVGAGNPTSATGVYRCGTTDTNDTIGSLAAGSGGGTLTCVGTTLASGTSAGPFTYTRTGSAVVVKGTLAGGPVPGAFTAACIFEPTSPPPITTYQLQCAFEFGV
jgi:hypothetical protein